MGWRQHAHDFAFSVIVVAAIGGALSICALLIDNLDVKQDAGQQKESEGGCANRDKQNAHIQPISLPRSFQSDAEASAQSERKSNERRDDSPSKCNTKIVPEPSGDFDQKAEKNDRHGNRTRDPIHSTSPAALNTSRLAEAGAESIRIGGGLSA